MLRFFNKVMVEVWWEIKAKSEREKLYKTEHQQGSDADGMRNCGSKGRTDRVITAQAH